VGSILANDLITDGWQGCLADDANFHHRVLSRAGRRQDSIAAPVPAGRREPAKGVGFSAVLELVSISCRA
jgi:hypothetical protein